jgi:hypothetical protein
MWRTDTGLKAWIVTLDMGLGHQRATYPLAPFAEGGIITLGSPTEGTQREARLWRGFRRAYELASRLKAVPLVGGLAFSLTDRLQSIPPYYPQRDLSRPTFAVRFLYSQLKRGLCRSLLGKIRTRPLPLVTSHMAPAIAADEAGYTPIYCILCDAEISRAWVAENPSKSGIHYLVPCERGILRLRSYGVPAERITLTGFPFPLELLGDRSLDTLRSDFARRIRNLRNGHPLTVTYAVGGAGAQRDIGRQILASLRGSLQRGTVRLNLVAGIRTEVKSFFERCIEELLPGCPNIRIIFARSKPEYFRRFSESIRSTDILWTKPSELSFYSGLGLPVIIAPPIGSQEILNRKWLLDIQAGIPQEDPRYAGEWLFDYQNEGRLFEAAWSGLLKVRKHGTYAIQDLLAAAGGPTLARSPSRRNRALQGIDWSIISFTDAAPLFPLPRRAVRRSQPPDLPSGASVPRWRRTPAHP